MSRNGGGIDQRPWLSWHPQPMMGREWRTSRGTNGDLRHRGGHQWSASTSIAWKPPHRQRSAGRTQKDGGRSGPTRTSPSGGPWVHPLGLFGPIHRTPPPPRHRSAWNLAGARSPAHASATACLDAPRHSHRMPFPSPPAQARHALRLISQPFPLGRARQGLANPRRATWEDRKGWRQRLSFLGRKASARPPSSSVSPLALSLPTLLPPQSALHSIPGSWYTAGSG